MLLESTTGFKIAKSALKKEGGLHYDVILAETGEVAGTADIIFTSVDFCRRDTRYLPLQKSGLNDADKITNLAYFHPYEAYEQDFGKLPESIKGTAPEELMKNIIEDSLENECKAIITMTGKEKMKIFLKRHGFTATDQYEQEYYGLLTFSSI